MFYINFLLDLEWYLADIYQKMCQKNIPRRYSNIVWSYCSFSPVCKWYIAYVTEEWELGGTVANESRANIERDGNPLYLCPSYSNL